MFPENINRPQRVYIVKTTINRDGLHCKRHFDGDHKTSHQLKRPRRLDVIFPRSENPWLTPRHCQGESKAKKKNKLLNKCLCVLFFTPMEKYFYFFSILENCINFVNDFNFYFQNYSRESLL